MIEGDIKSCFDQISHYALMTRLRRRVADRKVTRLVLHFLKAGVLDEDQFIRTSAGTPQGGILSPLLANIALSCIEQRYERWVHPKPTQRKNAQTDSQRAGQIARKNDRRAGRMVCLPIRYADDFVIFVHGDHHQAEAEKNVLAEHLRTTLGLELSAEKTRITPMTAAFEFLGHRVRLKWGRQGAYMALEIPKAKVVQLRYKVKQLTGRSTTPCSLAALLKRLNPVLRGWANFYRHCYGAHRVFSQIDWYVGGRLWRWLKKKHGRVGARRLLSRYLGWSRIGRRKVLQEDGIEPYLLDRTSVGRFRLWKMRQPDYAMTCGEPDA